MSNNIPQRKPTQAASKVTPIRRDSAPYSQEAEEALIGACIVNPLAFDQLSHNLAASDFFFIRQGCIWQAMANLRQRGEPIEPVLLVAELTTMDKLEESGGLAWFVQMSRNVPTSTHAEFYANVVKRLSSRRKVIIAADEAKALAMDESIPIEDIATPLETMQAALTDTDTTEMLDATQSAGLHHAAMLDLRANDNRVSTGLPELDNFIGKLRKGTFLIALANVEHGKSSFQQTVALNAAIAGKRVAFFNVADQSEFEIITRMLSMMSAMPRFNPGGEILKAFHLGEGRLTNPQAKLYTHLLGEFSKLPIHIDNTHGASPGQVYQLANRIKTRHGLDLVVIDYFQDMMLRQTKYKDRNAMLTAISVELRDLGLPEILDAPIVVGAQARQEVLDRNNKVPTKRDIAECGTASKHAIVILSLYRPYQVSYNAAEINDFQIAVAKNKQSGRAGIIDLRFNPDTTAIETRIIRP